MVHTHPNSQATEVAQTVIVTDGIKSCQKSKYTKIDTPPPSWLHHQLSTNMIKLISALNASLKLI